MSPPSHLFLHRWGERDRAKALLHGSIDTREGFGKAVAQGNLAALLQDEGKLAEALDTYQEVYRTFEGLGAKPQMAGTLHQQSVTLLQMGRYDEAIPLAEQSLALNRERGDEAGQAMSLHQLSILYHIKEDYPTATARSQEAEKLARRLENEHFVATILHQQGLIHTGLARAAPTEAEGAAHRQVALERFQESLAIKRRIGDEAGAAGSLGELGKLLREAGQMGEAIAAFNEYIETQQRLNNPAKLGIGLEWLGSVHERQGHYQAALEKYQQALALYEQYAPPEVERCKRNIALLKEKMKDEG